MLFIFSREEGRGKMFDMSLNFYVAVNSIDVIINFHLAIFLFSFVSSLMWNDDE